LQVLGKSRLGHVERQGQHHAQAQADHQQPGHESQDGIGGDDHADQQADPDDGGDEADQKADMEPNPQPEPEGR
jgi:hypothetical protein